MNLTKTNFLFFLKCPKSFWVKLNDRKNFPEEELNDFDKKLISDGEEVENYAQKLFPGGLEIRMGDESEELTKKAISSGEKILFQPTFISKEGLYARVDILEKNEDGSYNIYEVKSSSSVKEGRKHNYIYDVCFQKIALERSGLKVDKCHIIYLNKNYVLGEELDIHALFITEDVSEKVSTNYTAVLNKIEAALDFMKLESIDEAGCGCVNFTKSYHCQTFSRFNGELCEGNIYDLNNLREAKVQKLLASGIDKIININDEVKLTNYQALQVLSTKQDSPAINKERIREGLEKIIFPIYFFDYEATESAIPKLKGIGPHNQIPFQYSLHILHEDEKLEHFEYLSDAFELPENLLLQLQKDVSEKGTFVSWHKSYEMQRNEFMAKLYPEHAVFLRDINNRMFDLKDFFMGDYVSDKFKGSASIKKVLPVVCPSLSYKTLNIQDGTQAMGSWIQMLSLKGEEREEVRNNLLKYCELDTFAMVEIYRFLRTLVS